MDNDAWKTNSRADHQARGRKPGIFWFRITLSLVTISLCAGLLPQGVRAASIAPIERTITPHYMRGVWGQNGDCRHAKSLLIIRKTSASLQGDRFYKTVFIEHDGEFGGALHWAREYQSDNFLYDSVNDMIDWESEGYHMPLEMTFHFTRCAAKP